jgi:plasmid stability protein
MIAVLCNHYGCTATGATVKTASLTVRNIPKAVLERLRARAMRHRRSMQGEILAILEASAAETVTRRTVSQVLQQARSQGLRTAGDAARMVRADRDDR